MHEKTNLPQILPARGVPSGEAASARQGLPPLLMADDECVLGEDGCAYVIVSRGGVRVALRSGSGALHQYVRECARLQGFPRPRRSDINDVDYAVQCEAEARGARAPVWLRAAPISGGVEIDVGDEKHTRVRITANAVEVVTDSDTLFHRSRHMKALVLPADEGDLDLLTPYLPQEESLRLMLLAWITYTVAHAKTPQAKYVILVITGEQGSGKTALAKLVQRLIDPNAVAVQVPPTSAKDVAIATRNAHLVLYDNIRAFTPSLADALCIAATGGTVTGRQLYTDAEQQMIHVHGAVVLNGLHHFIDQPDLAQRCLRLELPVLPHGHRRSDADMERELDTALPQIMRGLYDLIASIFHVLPRAEVTEPHRMLDFVRWLSAMEIVFKRPYLQGLFVYLQTQGQRDALQENLLGETLLRFAEEELNEPWSGTPSELLAELERMVPRDAQNARDWPQNAIALARRLTPLQPALREQGISLKTSRGKQRRITIKRADRES